MKYKLETIPVWDAYKEDSECPYCILMEKAEKRYLKYYLGNSAMNPETRVELNKRGFCPEHFSLLLKERSPQHLGLITHTHLQDWMEDHRKSFPAVSSKKSLFKGASSSLESYINHGRSRRNDCLICERIERTIKRYTFTTCYLWKRNEENFRDFMTKSKGFCLSHEADLLSMAEEILNSKERGLFFEEVKELQFRNFQRLEEELNWFTQMFKAENAGKSWGTSEDAHYRVIQKLSGKK